MNATIIRLISAPLANISGGVNARLTIFALVVCGLSWAATPYAAAGELETRFRSEAPLAWRELREFCHGLRAQGSVVEAKNPGSKESSRTTSSFEYNARNGNLRFRTKYAEGPRAGRGQIACINSDYSFIIEEGGSRGSGEVTYVGISSKNVLRNQKLLNAMFTPLRILYANVDDLVAAADFKVSKAAHVSGGDRGLIKVDFTSKHEPVENFQVSGGWMILDSNRSWALREYRVDANQGAVTVHGVVDYEGEIKGYPLARHRQVELIDPATKTVNMTYDYDYSNVGPGDLEPRDCRLTAFGFPEPGIAKSRWLMVKLLAINGVLVGGLVLLSVYYRKRSSSRVQASPNSTPR